MQTYFRYHCFFCFLIFLNYFSLQAEEKKWLIVANGPSFSEEQFLEAKKGRTTLALDGAANYMLKIHPDVILGDFDSITNKDYWGILGTFDDINSSTLPYFGNFGVLIIPAKDQDYTDLEKGVAYCDSQGAESILIINATGGRMDHTLGNIGVLRKYYKPGRTLIIETENEFIEYVKDTSTIIKGNIGDHCAIMGYPEASMSTAGLAYNGINYSLKIGIQESICNTLSEPLATIAIHGEALVISPKSKSVKK